MRYTTAKARTLCARLAAGESLRAICADPKMPDMMNVYRWLMARPELRDQYVMAKHLLAQGLAEEIVEISDAGAGPDEGETAVRRARLRIDARKAALARLTPSAFAALSDAAMTNFTPDTLDGLEDWGPGWADA